MASSPFCSLETSRKWIENERAIAFPDAYPLAEGHTLVIPRKHVSSIYEFGADEQSAVWSLVAEVRQRLSIEPICFGGSPGGCRLKPKGI